jgi:signal transduction histidine kinase
MPVQAQLEQRDKNHAAGEEDPWRMEISLGASELRYYDLTPELLTILDKLRGIRTHKTFLFLIVSELLNNAIDHGLLRLDSAIKLEPEGFDRYMQLREERMAELDQGVITVSLERVRREGRRMLRISVRDSGNGFNPEQQAEALGPQSLPNRRGLNLVKNLSVEMEFLHHGAEVVAYFAY